MVSKVQRRSSTGTTPLENIIFFGLMLLVGLAPLPLGSNRPLPAAILALFASLLLLLWSLSAVSSGTRIATPPRWLAIPFGLFVLVCIWAGLQSASGLPATLIDPAWNLLNSILGTSLASRVSVNPDETLSALMHLVTYGVVFWLTVQTTRTPERAESALLIAMSIGGLYALYGLVIFLSGNEWITIYRKWTYTDSLTSTFVNRNSFATFAGLCLVCTVAVFLDRVASLLSLKRPWREKIIMLVEHVAARASWTSACLLMITFALMMTGSRAGNAATFFAILILLTLSMRGNGGLKRNHMLVITGIVAIVFIIAMLTSSNLLGQRLSNDDTVLTENVRFTVYEITMHAIASAPWTGTGFGTFANVFPAYRPDDLPIGVAWDRAHSTYLENALGLGLPAVIALNGAILAIAAQCLYGAFTRRRYRKFPIIGVAATALVGLHSVVDFSLEIPAVSVLFAFILGFATSQSWRTSEQT